jgi:hypothetical protein
MGGIDLPSSSGSDLTLPGTIHVRAGAGLARNSSLILLAACVSASALTFVWNHRFVPIQDYPDWLVQGKLFADLLNNRLATSYAFVGGLVPNAASTVAIGLVALFVHPESAAKLVLSAQLVGHACSALYLLTALGRPQNLVLVAVSLSLLLNYSFFHGNFNYLLSLVFLFWGQGLVLRRHGRFDASFMALLTMISLVIYFCHGAGYVAWLLFLGVVGMASGSTGVALRLLAVVSPSLVAATSYTISRIANSDGIGLQGYPFLLAMLGDKLWTLHRFVCPLPGFYPFLTTSLAWTLVAGNVIAEVAGVGALIRWSGPVLKSEDPRVRVILWTLAAYTLVFLAAPRGIGDLLRPDERMLLPAFQLLLTMMVPLMPSPRRIANRTASGIAVFLLGLQAVFLHGYAGSVARRLEATFHRLEPYMREPPYLLHESHFKFQGQPHPSRPLSWTLLPLHFPMLRLTYYMDLSLDRPVPIFATGLFRSALRPAPNDARSLGQFAGRTVLIVGWPPRAEAIIDLIKSPVSRLDTDGVSYVVFKVAVRSAQISASQPTLRPPDLTLVVPRS